MTRNAQHTSVARPRGQLGIDCPTVAGSRLLSLHGGLLFAALVLVSILAGGCYPHQQSRDESLDGISCKSVNAAFWNLKSCDMSGGDRVWYADWVSSGESAASVKFMKVTGINEVQASKARATLEQRYSLQASDEPLSRFIFDVCSDSRCTIPAWFSLPHSNDHLEWSFASDESGHTQALVFAYDREKNTCYYWNFFER